MLGSHMHLRVHENAFVVENLRRRNPAKCTYKKQEDKKGVQDERSFEKGLVKTTTRAPKERTQVLEKVHAQFREDEVGDRT